MKRLLLISLITACGSQDQSKVEEVAAKQTRTQQTNKVLVESPQIISFAVGTVAELLECTESISNQLAYAKDTNSFYVCENEQWSIVSIKGDKGDAGTNDEDGEDNFNYMPNVISSSGSIIGKLVTISESTYRYWVMLSDETRIEINRTGTLHSGLQFFFSGANCTGEKRTSRINGLFANATLDTIDNKVYKQVGSYQNSWAYQSRSNGSACNNLTGTINRAYKVEEYSLPGFTTWGEVEIDD